MGKNARSPVPSQASNMIHARVEHGIPDEEKANAMMTNSGRRLFVDNLQCHVVDDNTVVYARWVGDKVWI
jgi:hypothetical protein